jgi:hypothetical protein
VVRNWSATRCGSVEGAQDDAAGRTVAAGQCFTEPAQNSFPVAALEADAEDEDAKEMRASSFLMERRPAFSSSRWEPWPMNQLGRSIGHASPEEIWEIDEESLLVSADWGTYAP